MVKVRRNHQKQSNKGFLGKTSLLGALLTVLYLGFNFFSKNESHDHGTSVVINAPKGNSNDGPMDDILLPSTHNGAVVNHQYYSLSYVEKHEQPEWVAYYISKKRLNNKRAERARWFEEDPLVKTGSAGFKDYKGSGYDKGHMAPAADMAFSKEAMKECFYLSNMSPQVHNFNGGIWRELEELGRDWGRMYNKLYVVTGPIFKDNLGVIGRKNKVTVPGYYYKIFMDLEGNDKKAIAFVMPNKVSNKPVDAFITTIDDVEEMTGIDFFPDLDDELEEKLESNSIKGKWKFNKNLYKIRTQKWNVR